MIERQTMDYATKQLLIKSYGVLADVRTNWAGRDTLDGQELLCNLRDSIAKATTLSAEIVQYAYANNPFDVGHSA